MKILSRKQGREIKAELKKTEKIEPRIMQLPFLGLYRKREVFLDRFGRRMRVNDTANNTR